MSVTVGALEDPTCAYSTYCDSRNVNRDHTGTNRKVHKVNCVSNNQFSKIGQFKKYVLAYSTFRFQKVNTA